MGLNSSRVDLHVTSGLHAPLQFRGMRTSLPTRATAGEAATYINQAIRVAAGTALSKPPSLLVLHKFKRHRPGDYARIKLETPAKINSRADALVVGSPPFACVQWRTENSPVHGSVAGFSRCASSLAAATLSRMSMPQPGGILPQPGGIRQVTIVSDIFAGTSDTFHQGAAQAEARRVLQAKLPLSRLQNDFSIINDTGMRGMFELQVCARAAVVMTCGTRKLMSKLRVEGPPNQTVSVCPDCVKSNSGFTRHLIETRAKLREAAGVGLKAYYW
jgi:hypothetical protein